MRKIVPTVVSAIALTVAAGMVTPVAAQASTPPALTCGQTITASVRLSHDLVNCPGDGLVIGADNITLDLAGHSISGVNAPGSEGVADDGHRGASVRNGTIRSFFLNGVGLRNAPHSSVRNLTIRSIGAGGVDGDASAGVLVKDSPGTIVSASTISNDVSAYQSDGVDVASSEGTTVSGNRLVHNAWDGMFVYLSPHTLIVGNDIEGNGNQGTELNSGSDGSVLVGNHASNNVSDGLVVGAVSAARIEGNVLTGNGDTGLFMFDLQNSRITANRAGGNGAGINLDGGQNGSAGNRIVANDTSRNLFVGLVVGDAANNNTLIGNISNANQGPPGEGGGIVVFAATGNTVRANVASRNLDVGIAVFEDQPGDSPGNVLASNVANSNGAHGITVVTATVDGGGNIARLNTPLPNCVGITCA
jgi:parallel beta-helix repeat protein